MGDQTKRKVPSHAGNLDWFERLMKQNLPNCRTVREAYERTEAACEGVFGRRKYSGYESYRVQKSKKRKKR